MPYVTYAERRGEEKGILIGEKRGISIGEERGVTIGLAEGLHQGIYDILEIKFGDEGLALFEPVKKVKDIEILQAIRAGLKKAPTISEAKAVLTEELQKITDDADPAAENDA